MKELAEINRRYRFYIERNLNLTHTYDNNKFYSNISCADYLIYQLQFISGEVKDQAERIKANKEAYPHYLREIKAIQLGRFQKKTKGFMLKRLQNTEKDMFYKAFQHPALDFHMRVTLYCSYLNGNRYAKKTDDFSMKQVFTFIKRLKNKNGNFYNDREIWDSICRVERGKVSNKMRFSIYKRDGYRCRCCGRIEKQDNLEIDHIFPISKGGKSTYDNLQTLCRRCNREKGNDIYLL